MAIDSKLRGCDLVKLRISDVMHGTQILKRAIIMQQKTNKTVQFEITEQTRNSIRDILGETNPDGQAIFLEVASNNLNIYQPDNMLY